MDLQAYVDSGALPAAVSLVARGADIEVQVAGPVRRDSIFRLASVSKPITAAGVMLLIEDGKLALDDTVDKWLPELSDLKVVRTPESPVDDVVEAKRPITVFDLLTFRAGYGFPYDFSLPAARAVFDLTVAHILDPQAAPGPDEWIAKLASIPMLAQPGETWLYNTCSEIQSVLIPRVTGQSLPDFLAERVFEPLGMTDTGFMVPAGERDRFTTAYQNDLQVSSTPDDAAWSTMPAFANGAGGLVATADDLFRFNRALLDDSLLARESVRLMTTDHLTADQRQASEMFLEGQGWGFGGSVDVQTKDPWNVPGRYGWVGGSGTTSHVVPATSQVTILLTQVAMTGPSPTQIMRTFWRASALAG